MQTKYLGFLSCRYLSEKSLSFTEYKTTGNSLLLNKHKRIFMFMLKKLSLLLQGRDPETIYLFKQILEYLFCTSPHSYSNMHSALLQFTEMYWNAIDKNTEFWISLRSLYISVIQKAKGNESVHQNLVIKRAAINPLQFQTIIANQELNTSKLQQLKCYFLPFDVKISEDNIQTFMYLYNKNLIQMPDIEFIRDNWIYNQLKIKSKSFKESIDYQGIFKMALQNPYNPDIQQFLFLKDTEEGRKIFIKILLSKLQYTDDTVLWNQLFHFRELVNRKHRQQIVQHYYKFHFIMYLRRQVHKNCNKQFVLKYLNHRYDILGKLVSKFNQQSFKKIIDCIKRDLHK